MNSQIILELEKNGLIDKSQKWHSNIRNDISINMINQVFFAKIVSNDLLYQLKQKGTNLYLVSNNNRVEFIKYQNNERFREMSGFYLIYDDLLVTIIPATNPNLLLCCKSNSLLLKKRIDLG